MFQRNVKSWIRMIVSCIFTVAFISQPVGVSALHSNTALNAQLNNAIVFVSRKIPSAGSSYLAANQTGSLPGVGPYSRLQVAAPGKLLVLETSGTIRTLVDGSKPTAASFNLIDINSPDVSYDGTKIVFAGLVNGSYSTAPLNNPGAWRIYKINVDGTGLQQLTFSDQNNLDLSQFKTVADLFKKYDDFDPAWLPDGRIVFSSTRWPSFGQYGGSRTSNLYVVNADGSNLHRITSERNGADRPQVDPLTGKIVYARWWRNFRVATNSMATIADPNGGYIMKDGLLNIIHSQPPPNENEVGGFKNLERNTWQLATINPDGTQLAQWGGRSSSYFLGQITNHAYGGSFAPDGSFYANFFPMNNMTEAAGFGGIRHYLRGPKGYTPVIGVTDRNDSKYPLVSTNPPSYGIYKSAYAAEPEVLPNGQLLISWAPSIAQDYGLYVINADGTGLTRLYDNPGTTEIRARVIQPRPLPPIVEDKITQVASLLPPLAGGPYDTDGNFTFQDLNVYFNAPVDTNILSAMPVGSASTIRFFIDHQRSQQTGSTESFDWPILMKELAVNPDGSITTNSPADVPLFEQIRTAKPNYTVPLTGRTAIGEMGGAAHVAGMNFGRPGEVVTCVGCHAGHSMIPVPANPADAQWTNLAPGAALSVSSLDSSLTNANGLIDRRVKMQVANPLSKYWLSKSGLAPTSQWIQLTFPVPVTVRTVRLYNIPSFDSSIKVLNATVRLYIDKDAKNQVANKQSGALSDSGTDVAFNDVYTRAVRIEFNSVSGTAAGLGEVEVIARAEANVPLSTISGTTGAANTTIKYGTGQTVTDPTGAYSIPVLPGWSGTVTPSHPCYTFSPASLSYSNVVANQTGQNYSPTFDPGCAAPAGTYDDTDSHWMYAVSWQSYSGSGPYNGTLHYTSALGNIAWFPFNGTQFTLSYTQYPNRGSFEVSVDGNKVTTINANGTVQWQKTYTSPFFSAGAHFVQFKNIGGSGSVMDVDAIQILNTSAPGTGTYDDSNANWSYAGSWQSYTGSGPYNSTLHYTGTLGNTVSFPFSGTQFILSYTQYPNRGSFEVYVDGNKVTAINANGTVQWQKTYTSPTFAAGTHVAQFKNVGGSGTVMDVDAIQIFNGTTPVTAPGAGRYDNNDANWMYTGAWLNYSGTGPYNSTLKYTATVGDAASFAFTGTQFIFSYTQYPNRGSFEVYVDGSKVATINANGTVQWQKTYTSPTFAAGTHTVRFKNIGGSDTIIDVDAIQIQ